MSDFETKDRHARRRKRNLFARELNDRKGAFKLKVVNPKRNGPYKRERIDARLINNMEFESDE